MHLRHARPEDAAAITAIYNHAVEHTTAIWNEVTVDVQDRAAWIARHGPDSWKPAVDAVVAALAADGVTWVGTSGYCFGAPPAWYLALKGLSHATAVSHPSRLRVPEDLQV